MALDLIPQVFYDLIARVIPGCVLLITGFLTLLGPTKAVNFSTSILSQQNVLNIWSFTLFLIVAYVLGFIFNELWELVFGRIKRTKSRQDKEKYRKSCVAEYNTVRKCFGQRELKFENLPSTHVMHDYLRVNSAAEGYRLLKLRAEAQLSGSLVTGFVFSAIINLILWYAEGNLFILDRAVLEVTVVVAVITFWVGNRRFEKFYINGTCLSWLFSSFPIEPHQETDAKMEE